MDSIRENIAKEDMVTTILMELSEDVENEKSVVLVEGSDDIELTKHLFAEHVIIKESYAGKHGLKDLILHEALNEKPVIAICDRDYDSEKEFPERMFAYDHCAMELMLLSCREVADRLYDVYYKGPGNQSDYIQKGLRSLAPVSALRMKNEQNRLGINFRHVRFGKWLSETGEVDIRGIFKGLSQTDEMEEECRREAAAFAEDELWDVTNGHDICTYLGAFSFRASNKVMGEEAVRKVMIFGYRKDDFKKTQLYKKIFNYQKEHHTLYLDT